MEQWYVLYTKPHSEYRVDASLRTRGFETFLPEVMTAEKQRPRLKQPLFPCYLFMRADLARTPRSEWTWTPGLRTIVSFEGQPLPLPRQAVMDIRRQLRVINARGGLPKHPFKPGDVVRVTEGPFADMFAIFDGPTTPSERVRILIHFLGRVNSVTLPANKLEKAPRDAQATAPPDRRRTRGRGRRIRYEE